MKKNSILCALVICLALTTSFASAKSKKVQIKFQFNFISSGVITQTTKEAPQSLYLFPLTNTAVAPTETAIQSVSTEDNSGKGFTVASVTTRNEETVELQLLDENGKLVFSRSEKVSKGIKTIVVNNLEKFQSGKYTLRVITAASSSNHPLVIF